ncbi:MAG: hypothetical protein JRH20_07520 [Deltaproteobacteria bacterium]|nr:hypothetical protein [Deltaproteobacteria bacterium]
MHTPPAQPDVAQRSLIISIFGAHTKRIGLLRTAIGGGVMYLTVPLFVFLHLTVVVFMYRFLLAPLLGLPRLRARDYIILDRHKIAGLHWFDKLNCWFCGYANGTIKLMNDELDKLASSSNKAPLWALPIVELYTLVNVVLLFVGLVMTTVVLAVISKALGLHRGSLRRIKIQLRKDRYASGYHPLHRQVIIFYKVVAMVIAYNLEQIESGWCPLKHLEKEGQVLPAHHERFLSRDELGEMKEILAAEGTVSAKKPKW